ncbi:MAG: GNAT family N-acetyltransferase [Thermoanaerobaculia bacterium]|nr:MAG: GNAT family N-acetyltransferase [Thermoanaerobaculia bacterium]
MIQVAREYVLSIEEFRAVLVESTLGERRPVEESARLGRMLAHANLIVTARDEGGRLVGIARSLTDFAYCCYLSDLAVSRELQKQGIGRGLIEETLRHLEPGAKLILLAAPAAVDYYAKVGFERHPSAWTRGA